MKTRENVSTLFKILYHFRFGSLVGACIILKVWFDNKNGLSPTICSCPLLNEVKTFFLVFLT